MITRSNQDRRDHRSAPVIHDPAPSHWRLIPKPVLSRAPAAVAGASPAGRSSRAYAGAMADHEHELIQLIEGSPPEVGLPEMAREIGISEDEAERLIADLERAGRLRRDGDRLIVVASDEDA